MSFDFETTLAVAFIFTIVTWLYTMIAAWVRWLVRYGPSALASLTIGWLAIEHTHVMTAAGISCALFLAAKIILARNWRKLAN